MRLFTKLSDKLNGSGSSSSLFTPNKAANMGDKEDIVPAMLLQTQYPKPPVSDTATHHHHTTPQIPTMLQRHTTPHPTIQ
ncbi:hypothetical protein N7492_000534 [Penicillium capsulatum]|uniref:Uncharacterized protein n=1 Tax=Penicillium capsulatum TaxID=69766 RepID=A0A9W9LYU5_9EURO|nr:hypothetical protein N7492_000534 [Penicillium capsulatum]KAJ6130407.1 hypothetical protein N7512_003187 [Penicillium capsulatum]